MLIGAKNRQLPAICSAVHDQNLHHRDASLVDNALRLKRNAIFNVLNAQGVEVELFNANT